MAHPEVLNQVVRDAVEAERARVRREEVEPLKEALMEVLSCEDRIVSWEERVAVLVDARAALRAADERGK